MGKSLQPLNAMAARPPVSTPAATAAPAASEPVTAESLGWQLRAALPPLRLHSVSLYDDQANVLWLSEGALGPDEHNLVVDAIESLTNDRSLPCYENGVEDGRIAIFLPVRSPQADLVGVVMILADMKSAGDGILDRIVTPQIRTIMQKIAVLIRATAAAAKPTVPAAQVAATNGAASPVTTAATSAAATTTATAKTAATPPSTATGAAKGAAPPIKPSTPAPVVAPAAAPATLSPSVGSASGLSPQAINDILEFELSPEVSGPRKTIPVETNTDATGLNWDAGAALQLLPDTTTDVAPVAASTPTTGPRPSSSNTAPASNTASASASPPAPAPAHVRSTAATTGSRALPSPVAGPAATTPASSPTGTTTTSRALAIDPSSIILDVQPFSKLRSGGRMRRYEVLPRVPNRAPAALDGLALQRLAAWLGANRAAWNLEPTSFSLNLSIATLEDDRFLQQVASCLKNNGIAPDNIGFEIAEPLCTQRRAQVERFISLCDKLGCFVVIDDFSFDSAVLPLLRSKAVRLVKIDPKLTSSAMRDKLSQAVVVAIVQAVKVLGIHCVAKKVESQASLQWLTAIGCDLAQGSVLSPPLPIESLNMPHGTAVTAKG